MMRPRGLNPSRWTSIAVAALLLASGCTPERKTFGVQWAAAVGSKDARAAWALLDKASQGRIVEAIKRSQDKAAKDAEFRSLFDDAVAPSSATAAPEEVAAAMLKDALADADVADDGATPSVHIENRKWRVAVEPYGFNDPDGAPLSLAIRMPGRAEPAAPDGGAPPQVATFLPKATEAGSWRSTNDFYEPGLVSKGHVENGVPIQERPDEKEKAIIVAWTMKDPSGRDVSKMSDVDRFKMMLGRGGADLVVDKAVGFHAYLIETDKPAAVAKLVARVAELAKLPRAFATAAPKIMLHYDAWRKRADEHASLRWDVDAAGGLDAAAVRVFLESGSKRRGEERVGPHLSFGAWR